MRRAIVVSVLVVATVEDRRVDRARPVHGDDLSVRVHFVRGSTATSTTSLANDVQFDIFTDGPSQSATMKYSLPAGLVFGAADQPDPTELCTNGTPVVCTVTLEEQIFRVQLELELADRTPRALARTRSLRRSRGRAPTPDPANNSYTFTFEIKTETATGGTGGGAVSVSANAVKLTPAKPKAGSVLVASATVTADGSPVRPSKVVCAGTLAGKKAIGTGTAVTGKASCRYSTPKTAKGKTLAGSLKITARGKTITKRFATKLGWPIARYRATRYTDCGLRLVLRLREPTVHGLTGKSQRPRFPPRWPRSRGHPLPPPRSRSR